MKKLILPLLLFYTFCFSLYVNAFQLQKGEGILKNNFRFPGNAVQTSSIDQLDSVLFDLSQAVFTSNSVEIPVSIVSNDTIFALDFSFQYNHNNLLYDSIIDLTSYMISSSFYNTVDSTVRFTSYGTQSYGIGTSLVSIKFDLLNGMVGVNDLFSLTAYLNGDPCSVKLKGALPANVNEKEKISYQMVLFPCPATSSIHVKTSVDGIISIVDLSGRVVVNSLNVFKNQESQIDIRSLSSGSYIVLFSDEGFLSTKKLTVFH